MTRRTCTDSTWSTCRRTGETLPDRSISRDTHGTKRHNWTAAPHACSPSSEVAPRQRSGRKGLAARTSAYEMGDRATDESSDRAVCPSGEASSSARRRRAKPRGIDHVAPRLDHEAGHRAVPGLEPRAGELRTVENGREPRRRAINRAHEVADAPGLETGARPVARRAPRIVRGATVPASASRGRERDRHRHGRRCHDHVAVSPRPALPKRTGRGA